jgi:hypothetical protein
VAIPQFRGFFPVHLSVLSRNSRPGAFGGPVLSNILFFIAINKRNSRARGLLVFGMPFGACRHTSRYYNQKSGGCKKTGKPFADPPQCGTSHANVRSQVDKFIPPGLG